MKWAKSADQVLKILERDIKKANTALPKEERIKEHLTDPDKNTGIRTSTSGDVVVKENFLIYDDMHEFKKLLDNNVFNEWGTYDFPSTDYSNAGDHARERYELFIGGYLHYYDSEIKDGKTDHAIHFDWETPGKVTIWIAPILKEDGTVNYKFMTTPASGDPPKPKGPPPPY